MNDLLTEGFFVDRDGVKSSDVQNKRAKLKNGKR